MDNTKKKNIKIPILLPLCLAILVLLGGTVVGIFWLQDQHITNSAQARIDSVEKVFRHERNADAEMLSGLIEFLERDKILQDAYLARDRQALLDYALPLFDDIRSKHRVTHFYFHDIDKTCFLRVHSPSRYGDDIKRFTMQEAADAQKPAHGIELGPFGTFTLRMVHPWHIDGKVVGYLERGE